MSKERVTPSFSLSGFSDMIFGKPTKTRSLTDELEGALDVFRKAQDTLRGIASKCDEQVRESKADEEIAQQLYDTAMDAAKKKADEAEQVRQKVLKSAQAMGTLLGE